MKLDTSNIKKHVSYQCSADVKSICSPLFDAFNISFFDYIKIYPDNTLAILATDRDWYYHWLQSKTPLLGTLSNKKVNLWDKLVCPTLLHDAHCVFGHNHGVILVNKQAEYTEQIEIAANNKDHYAAISLVLNYPDILNKFILYFKDKAFGLIGTADKNRCIISHAMSSSKKDKQSHEEFCSSITANKIHLNYGSKKFILSRREYEVISEFAKGKTAKEVANTLGISYRTVEHRLEDAKNKTSCTSKLRLIDIIKRNLMMAEII